MVIEANVNSLNKEARIAGLLYLIWILTAAYEMYATSQLGIKGADAATIDHLLEHEFLFRTIIANSLVSGLLFIFLAFAFYRLLRQVNEHLAKLMVALVLVQLPIVFFIETCHITSLMIVKGEALKELEQLQQQGIAMLFYKMAGYGTMTLEIFWGLWLIPLGQLIYRSGYIPRLLGGLLVIAGIGYVIDSFTVLLFPELRTFTMTPAFLFSGLGEILITFWLLIKGVKSKQPLPSTAF
jgi:hypothetical protein